MIKSTDFLTDKNLHKEQILNLNSCIDFVRKTAQN